MFLMTRETMITIGRFQLPEDAHLFRAFLESQEIPASVLDENVAQLFWHYSDAIGGVRVVVDDSDAEEAAAAHLEYMEGLRTGPYPLTVPRGGVLMALFAIAFGLPALIFGRRLIGSQASPVEDRAA